MISYLRHSEIDKKKWDNCVSESQEAGIFVCSFYLDTVDENWTALVLNDYEAVFPIATGTRYGMSYIYQPFFTRYFGLYSKQKVSARLVKAFFEAIPAKFKYIEFCLHEKNEFSVEGYEKRERKYQLLDLNRPYQELYRDYSDNARRNIKRAAKAGCEVQEGIAPSEIVNLFRRTKGQELEVFKAKDYKKLIRLMEICVEKKMAESIAVYDQDGKLGAAGFFMLYKNRYVFLKSGVTEVGKSNGYMHLLFDTFIRKHSGKEAELDFGGSSVESVARFYKNFGAKDCVYLQVKKNRLPKLINLIKSFKK
jgi:hypothetical protein